LFSLVSLIAQTRRREIGIRKVLGASIINAIFILIREYVILIAATNIIAIPIVYFLMNKWLNNFVYRIQIDAWIFILSGLLALIIALLTVIFQAIKAATTNPVESLRYE
jgi:putative ABC transport system permease protein